MPENIRFGHWTAEELGKTLRAGSGVGSDTDLEDSSRFIRGVARAISEREAQEDSQSDPQSITVFLLSPEHISYESPDWHPRLDTGEKALTGRIWFVNAPVVSGTAQRLDTNDEREMFTTIRKVLDVGHAPAIIVFPGRDFTKLRFYPGGLNQPDCCETIPLGRVVTVEEITTAIDTVYKNCLMTPDAQPDGNRLWKDAAKHYPHSDAEVRIQAYLKPALCTSFPSCNIYHEDRGITGRSDLHIEQPSIHDRSQVIRHAVIELKVLRSLGESGRSYSPNEVTEAIRSGLDQAAAYKEEKGHRLALLCCFDMRKADTGEQCFNGIKGTARDREVHLRRWYLFATSKLLRESLNKSAPK